MKRIYIVALLFFFICAFALSQVPPDRNSLLNGEEGIQAKVAGELGYPSPKSVLDDAATLKLTDDQKKQLKIIQSELTNRAQQLGKQVVKIEQELHDALQAGLVNEKAVGDDAQQIGRLRGRLRGVFLAAHLQTKKLLNSSQLEIYKKTSVSEEKK